MSSFDTKPVPSLSTDGWAREITQKCDYLLAHFYASEITQTHFFPRNVHSIVNLVQQYNQDPVNLGIQTQESLTTYLTAYFKTATVRVTCTEEPDRPSYYALHIYAEVTNDEGEKYNLANIVQYQGSKIMNISRINDGGSVI